jgi:hypothetical protein
MVYRAGALTDEREFLPSATICCIATSKLLCADGLKEYGQIAS